MRLKYAASLFLLTCLLGLPSIVEAATIEGRLLAATFRGRVTRGVSIKTKVILGGGLFKTHINSDGTFEFPDVPTGTYILEVQSPQLVYSKVRIVVTSDEVLATRVSIGDHFSGKQQFLPLPLTLRPRPRPIHYIPPEGQKVAGFFGNPMVLMSSFSLLMLLLMPKIMANLDADALNALRSSYDFGCLPSMAPPHPMTGHQPPTMAPHHYNPHYQHQQPLQQHQDLTSASKDPHLVGGSSSMDDEKNEFGDEFVTGIVPSWGEKGVTTAASQAGPGASDQSNHYLPHHSYPSYPHNQKQPYPFQPQPQPQTVHQQQFIIPPVQSKKLK